MVFWDNRVIELLQAKVSAFSISYHCKNYEDNFKWIFTSVYGLILDEERKTFWVTVPNINRLWNDPWYIGREFNMVRNCSRCSLSMRQISKIIKELNL